MPEKRTAEVAQKRKRQGISASAQAGEYVHAAIERVRDGRHGARSAKQAIAIGLSQARRDGVKLPAPAASAKAVKKKAAQDTDAGKHPHKPSPTRSKASTDALKKEGRRAVSKKSLSAQTKTASATRSPSSRSVAAKKAAATKGATGRSTARKKAARTRRKA